MERVFPHLTTAPGWRDTRVLLEGEERWPGLGAGEHLPKSGTRPRWFLLPVAAPGGKG